MDEQKKVRVTMNQEDQMDKKHDLEHYLTPKNKKTQSSYLGLRGKSKMSNMLKPILLAVLLGVFFGAGLIYYFSDLTPDALPATTTEIEEEDDNNNPNENENTTSSENTFTKPGQVYEVIQFGVFSSKVNADELVSKSLAPSSVPSTIHEQGGQYFVISHLIKSESEKSATTDWLESNDFVYMDDFFYKSWSFDAINANVEEESVDWLNAGLEVITKGESGANNWQSELSEWINQQPTQYEQSDKLAAVKNLLSDLNNNTDQAHQNFIKQTILLNLHLFYTNLA